MPISFWLWHFDRCFLTTKLVFSESQSAQESGRKCPQWSPSKISKPWIRGAIQHLQRIAQFLNSWNSSSFFFHPQTSTTCRSRLLRLPQLEVCLVDAVATRSGSGRRSCGAGLCLKALALQLRDLQNVGAGLEVHRM